MKKYGFLILAVALLAGGCQHQHIDKQEADAIVTKYIKENFKSDNRTRAAYYYNELEQERIEMSFLSGEESIIAEDAFVYYIHEGFGVSDYLSCPYRIILVSKKNGEYTVFQRAVSPYVHPQGEWDNWTLLYMFANGQFWN